MNLLELDKKRTMTLEHESKHQVVIKCWFDKRATIKAIRISDLLLIWDQVKENLRSHTKFQCLWIDHYQIMEILGDDT